jgi:serine/threonine protein kinase
MQSTFATGPGKSNQHDAAQGADGLPAVGQAFMNNLLRMRLLRPSVADMFLKKHAEVLPECDSAAALADYLVGAGVLTEYQRDRNFAGTTYGLVLGQYVIRQRLGAGGMGIVFLAEHELMKRKVAVKTMPVDDHSNPDMIKRFYLEMQVLARLHHPNIVTAFDSGQVDGPPGFPNLLYLVMEYVDGCDLERHVDEHGPAQMAQACAWIQQAARGLNEAHNHNLVHRDLKPSNLLLARDGTVKLVDFGLVRQFSSSLTDPKSTLGTLDFMPPEQCIDPSSVGTLADIYALGATLFWLLTGKPLFARASTLTAAMKQLQSVAPRRLRELRPEAPPELEALLLRLVERDPTRRPPTPMNVIKALQPFTAA